jgi:HPr kinase/phosphorylase
MSSLKLTAIIKEFNLEILNSSLDISKIEFLQPEINRPALQLTGFYEHFDSDRLQIVGKVEYAYLQKMDEMKRRETIKKLFAHKLPALVICKGLEPFDEMLEFGNRNNTPILRYDGDTSEFMGEVIKLLKSKLAPRITMHGVLVDIYGEGVLIMGDSGVGKSETALELIKRGHRLVADDAVEIKRVSKSTLIGNSPEVIRYFIELRGIGIIDVKQMFGVHSVKAAQEIDLVLNLEIWDNEKQYDRLGLEDEYINILGKDVVCANIPIRPGRNLAIICESAAINHRQKKMGYNAAQVLNERIIENMENNN